MSIDFNKIKQLLSEIVSDTLSGTIKYKEVKATISLPTQIVDIFQHVADVQGIPLETMISQAASQGINSHLKDIQQYQNTTRPDASSLPLGGINLPEGLEGLEGLENMPLPEGFGNKLGELKDMVAKFQGIADQMKDIEEQLKVKDED